jgi:predicted transcriptional regulator
MARPKVHGARITTAIRLSPELHNQLQKAAAERDVAVNFLVVKAIEDYLPRLLPVSELRLTRAIVDTLTDTKEDKEEPLIDAQRRWGLRD